MNNIIIKALQFASEKHKDQRRRGSGLPYVTHPIIVSELLREYKSSKNLTSLIVASLLHDTLEDTDTTFQEISNTFTPMIAGLVLELTSDMEKIKEIGKNPYLIQKCNGMTSYGLVIKLVDRLSNIMDGPTKKYCQDTLVLLGAIEIGREEELSGTHQRIINDIRVEVNKFLNEGN